jgi:hypothetical protein
LALHAALEGCIGRNRCPLQSRVGTNICRDVGGRISFLKEITNINLLAYDGTLNSFLSETVYVATAFYHTGNIMFCTIGHLVHWFQLNFT